MPKTGKTYPDWVQEYRTRGTTVKRKGEKYYLYKRTSRRVPGKKYPQPVDTYIGVITPEGVLKSDKKKVTLTDASVKEFGFSRAVEISRSFFADSSIHTCLFLSLLLRFPSIPRSLCIFLAQTGQYFDMPEPGTYSTPHTVQCLTGNAVHRFVGVICNSPTKPMNL